MSVLKHPGTAAVSRRQFAVLASGTCLLVCCLLAGCAPTITGTVTGRNSTSTATSPFGYTAAPGLLLVSTLGGMVFAVAAVVDNLSGGIRTASRWSSSIWSSAQLA